MGMVRPVAAGEPAALDPDVFRGPGSPFMIEAGQLSTGHTVCGQSGGWKTVICRRGAFRWPVNNV